MLRKRTAIILFLLLTTLLLLSACGSQNEQEAQAGNSYYYPETESQESTQDSSAQETEMYIITAWDSAKESLRAYRISNGLEYQYYYGLATSFFDAYGGHTTGAGFCPGMAVYLGNVDTDGQLYSVTEANQVWKQEDITNFSFDSQRGVATIGSTTYSFDEATFFFSDNRQISPEDLTEQDRLTVIGQDKKLLSVIVTTGHGTLALTNTELFEGSYVQLGTSIFAIITPDMTLEVPEGSYELAVANDGWGGTCSITITRDQTTTVDLDQIKGDGPQYGQILFLVDVEGASLNVDNTPVALGEPVSLKYGWHTMTVTAEGYEDWTKKLYVNSAEATIEITLDSEEEDSEADADADEQTEDDTDDSDETTADGDSSDTTSNATTSDDTTSEADILNDYMSTLTDLLTDL